MQALTFKTAFKYPFNRPVGLLNILWMFLPIVGWFALSGYIISVTREFIEGKFVKLPLFDFAKHIKIGFDMFVRYIPFMLANLIVSSIVNATDSYVIIITYYVAQTLILPVVYINFVHKGTVKSSFEFNLVNVVFENFKPYVTILAKSFLLMLVYIPMSIVLVGIPAASFTRNIFMADFYRRYVKGEDIEVVPLVENDVL